jgi:hypothetical protein
MISVIHESKPKARKDYNCDACEFLFNAPVLEIGLTFTEYRAVVKATQAKYRILKGTKYIRQFNSDDSGNSWTFRAILDIHLICINHDLYYD